MSGWPLFLILIAALLVHYRAILRARSLLARPDARTGRRPLAATPGEHGLLAALTVLLPCVALWLGWVLCQTDLILWLAQQDLEAADTARIAALTTGEWQLLLLAAENPARETTEGLAHRLAGAIDTATLWVHRVEWGTLGLACLGSALWGLGRIQPDHPAGRKIERILHVALFVSAAAAMLVTFGILATMLVDALRFFARVSPLGFFFSAHWSPQPVLQPDGTPADGAFGALPLFSGTLLITLVAMGVAGSVGLMTAIYLSGYAQNRTRNLVRPALEILAGIPTVVYGLLTITFLAPALVRLVHSLGGELSPEGALPVGLMMGIMIIPLVSSLSDDVIRAVPASLREASFGLGATRSETMVRVVLPAAAPGLFAAMLLATSRAIGETMIVVMAAGLSARLTLNPMEATTTVTVQIVSLLVGDSSFDSTRTLAAFGLGLTLFGITMLMNLAALSATRRYHARHAAH